MDDKLKAIYWEYLNRGVIAAHAQCARYAQLEDYKSANGWANTARGLQLIRDSLNDSTELNYQI